MADFGSQQRKLQILCLHGSRQDGEVFLQRLKTLKKKLKSIAVSGGIRPDGCHNVSICRLTSNRSVANFCWLSASHAISLQQPVQQP
jgi:hypothetical protein